MANVCEFDMQISGKEDAINELVNMFMWKGNEHTPGLGRLFLFEPDPVEESAVPGIYTLYASGDCANSLKSSMLDDGIRYPSLESETERLGLVVEAFSKEPGYEFSEHVLVAKGDLVINDCVHYEAHVVEDYPSVEKYNEIHGTSFTSDMVDCNGEVVIGGFGDGYMDWQDVSQYFAEEQNKEKVRSALDEQEVCALYDGEDEFYSIVKAPNGKFFNYYSKDGLVHGYGSAGPFDDIAEAKKMLLKHRPHAKLVEDSKTALPSLEEQIEHAADHSKVMNTAFSKGKNLNNER